MDEKLTAVQAVEQRPFRRLLRRIGVYERAKASWIYDAYWSVANRRIIDDRKKELDFYRDLLGGFREGDVIFDIGANQGYKVDIFLRLGANVIAVEPDESNQAILKEKFLSYRFKKKQLTIVPKAVSDTNAIETFWIEAPGSAKNTLSQKWATILEDDGQRFGEKLNFGVSKDVETITMEQLNIEYGVPLFIKIDVEGHELSVLRGMTRPVPYLSFEVNLPEFRPEGLECIQVLSRLAPDGEFNFAKDCRRGLQLKQWVSEKEFAPILNSCSDESIEVFWKTSVRRK
jgi:FkbM family methyltransferase